MSDVSETILQNGDGGSRPAHSGPSGSEAGRHLLDTSDAALATRPQVGTPSLLDYIERAQAALGDLAGNYDRLPNPLSPGHYAWDLLGELEAVSKDCVRLRNNLIGDWS